MLITGKSNNTEFLVLVKTGKGNNFIFIVLGLTGKVNPLFQLEQELGRRRTDWVNGLQGYSYMLFAKNTV